VSIPNEILILPVRTNARDLEHKNAVVVKQIVDLPEESTIAPDTNMLIDSMLKKAA
jgi:hypothetical protein